MLKRQPFIGEKTQWLFFLKGVGGELIIYREQEWNSEQLREAREGGRNGKISGGGGMSWGTGRYEERQFFVNREAQSGTVSSGHVWPVKCVTCLPKLKISDENNNIKVLICYLCVVTPSLWFNQPQIKNIQKGQGMWFSGRMLVWHAKCEYTTEGTLPQTVTSYLWHLAAEFGAMLRANHPHCSVV